MQIRNQPANFSRSRMINTWKRIDNNNWKILTKIWNWSNSMQHNIISSSASCIVYSALEWQSKLYNSKRQLSNISFNLTSAIAKKLQSSGAIVEFRNSYPLDLHMFPERGAATRWYMAKLSRAFMTRDKNHGRQPPAYGEAPVAEILCKCDFLWLVK